ncbi:transcriptional regulator, PadR-family [Gemmatirosa kalamazoonensis]|uniref:Transcriptional regulator, PadR-family n=1 Tax=Gemmatirosa kalamazoonensis TaxID=861299 RepID=W0RF11_9BACT|nr:PadR family transcriptional regulator [Gemmatirosa kalamazoonensis]AHG87968.1 transcriptional regulator, PadR-family [Gemmatirosa kalamazoonensis]
MRVDLPQGTLETLVLKTLTWGPMHGYGVGRWIERTSDDSLIVEEGSLYPALHRMEKRGWIAPDWRQTENNRRAKYYVLTDEGRRQLASQTQRWSYLVASIGRVLEASTP